MNGRHIVAVDGGGTRSRVALARADGRIIAQVEGGFANLTSDFEASRQNIMQAIEAVYTAANIAPANRPAGIAPSDIAVLGIAGANVGTGAEQLSAALDFASVHVMSDREITIAGVLGDGDGTLVQAGTGSFFVSRFQGRLNQIGGWGLQLGDDCGGAWLGRELLRWTLKAHDGVIETTELVRRVLARFDNSPSEIVRFAQTATPQHFGAFAPEIFDARDAGDAVAIRIIKAALADLDGILESLDAIRTQQIHLRGSVGERYTPLLRDDFRQLVVKGTGDGLSGAVGLGVRLLQQMPPAPPG
jgi:glucosamine kinase